MASYRVAVVSMAYRADAGKGTADCDPTAKRRFARQRGYGFAFLPHLSPARADLLAGEVQGNAGWRDEKLGAPYGTAVKK